MAAAWLSGAGLSRRRIARILGVSTTTLRRWSDPAYNNAVYRDAAARKANCRGVCIDCGGPTAYTGRKSRVTVRCATCYRVWQVSPAGRASLTRWTQEAIIARIREWAELYGEPPRIADWNPYAAQRSFSAWHGHRFLVERGRWPSFSTVITRFGTWNAAIAAAGYTPRAAHGGVGGAIPG